MSSFGEQMETMFRGHMTSAQRQCTHYLDDFIALKCAPDLLALGVFPNIKEITESQAAYRACKRLYRPVDASVTAVVVGDGCTPRTGALLAFRTQWNVYSVDPALKRREHDYDNVRRLYIVPKKIEDFQLVVSGPLLIVAVHSHAPMEPTLGNLHGNPKHFIAMPCCYSLDVPGVAPDAVYGDYGIMSPKCDVKVYKNVKENLA